MTLFDLSETKKAQLFRHFIHGPDMSEAVLAARKASQGTDSAYLWGKPGSGKTHLLNAAREEARTNGVNVAGAGESMNGEHNTLYVIDDVGELDLDLQQWLFGMLREVLQGNPATQVLIAGEDAAADLILRKDVRSRLQELPSYQLSVLGDKDLVDALVSHADRFGRTLPTQVARELVTLLPRDMANLSAACEELDSYAIANNVELTAKMVRDWVGQAGKEA